MQKVDEEGIALKMPEFDNWEEYHIVSKNFNNMMEKIKILKIDVYEKEKKQSELYKQYLMLQINPHFFLNALNTIYMLNKRKDNNQVNILLTYLINYFKRFNSHPRFTFCKRVSHFESDLQILYPTFHFCNDFPVFSLAFMI